MRRSYTETDTPQRVQSDDDKPPVLLQRATAGLLIHANRGGTQFRIDAVRPGLALGHTGSGDETAIRRVIQQYDDARSKNDWKTATSLFVEDGSNLTSSGEWRRGRAEIEKRGAATTTGEYKGGKFATKIDTVRLLAPTVALADGSLR